MPWTNIDTARAVAKELGEIAPGAEVRFETSPYNADEARVMLTMRDPATGTIGGAELGLHGADTAKKMVTAARRELRDRQAAARGRVRRENAPN